MRGEFGSQTLRPRIGIIDSGVGGLSVFEKVHAALPGARYIYCADNLHFPYGIKTDAQVTAAVRRAILKLIERYALDLIVVACNTASTITLPHLRAEFKVPIVGVVPAIKPAAALSKSGVIGLLATPLAVVQPYTDELIRRFANHCEVVRVGSRWLIDAAERKLRGEAIALHQVATELAPFFAVRAPAAKKVDVVILGCTHFPLLQAELAASAAWPLTFIDSGAAIASRVCHLLGQHDPASLAAAAELPQHDGTPTNIAVFTKDDASIASLTAALAGFGLSKVEIL